MTTQECNGDRRQVSAQAGQAIHDWLAHGHLTQADDDSFLHALPAAQALLGGGPSSQDGLSAGLSRLARLSDEARLIDPAGHRRPIYRALSLHLHLTAWRRSVRSPWPASADAALRALARSRDGRADDEAGVEIHLALWQALCAMTLACGGDDDDAKGRVMAQVDALLCANVHRDGALHAQDPDASLDAWTYRELAGLHALDHLAMLADHAPWRERVAQVVAHHVECTQPDNTTNQPWGLAAFLNHPDGRDFGQQQLHDAITQGRGVHAGTLGDTSATTARTQPPGVLPGMLPGGEGLVAALLLADACVRL